MKRLFLVFAALAAYGCAHGGEADIATLASSSDQIIWQAGQKAYERKNWESARKYFKRILDGFPQSELGPVARLALADSYFQEAGTANNVLAISEYRQFLTLYPSHPRSDYAQLQVGECFFHQRNGPDRDQTQTQKALEEYQRLLDLFPSSPHVETARVKIKACRQTLARSEFQIGYFYQHTRQAYRSAIIRYERVVSEYPDYGQLDEVFYRLAQSLSLAGRANEARPYLARLLETYPKSAFAEPARKLVTELDQAPAAPPAPPAASPSPTPAQASPSPGQP